MDETAVSDLSPEQQEEIAIEVAISLEAAETYMTDAEQAIGRALSMDPPSARHFLTDLMLRKRIEARPAASVKAANRVEQPGHFFYPPCKWFRTNRKDNE